MTPSINLTKDLQPAGICRRWRADWRVRLVLPPPFRTAACMTVILLLLYGGDTWYLKRSLVLLCVAGLMQPRMQRSSVFWLVVVAVLVGGNRIVWFAIDNHKYLIMYWCVALYFACSNASFERSLALSARYLIGLAFLFATLWKLFSPDYLNGTFFHYSLLLDERFRVVASMVGGISASMNQHNHTALRSLIEPASTLYAVQLVSSPSSRLAAVLITWWTITLEAAIALVYLAPSTRQIARLRDPLLLLFILTTYTVAPVIGFGWTIVVMGVAQSAPRSRIVPWLYVGAFFVLQVYLVPWQQMLLP